MGRLGGKRALITGAGSGLGAAIAAAFAREGARLALTDINFDAVASVADAINAAHGAGTAKALRHDVTDEDQWIAVLGEADAFLHGLNLLVNNAGIVAMGSVEAETLDNWRRVQSIDVESVFLGCKHAITHMRPHAPGAIVNISSLAGLLGAPDMAAYNAAKAAVWLLTKSIALHCARERYDIRCNSVHPGFISTPLLNDVKSAMKGKSDEEAMVALARGVPLRRLGEPDDVAWACVYLASEEARFVTGIELKIDGGVSAQ